MSNVSLKFTSLISSKILDELQKNIQNYAQNHIKNFTESQDYELLKKTHNGSNLFVDDLFPACDESVFTTANFQKYLLKKNRLSANGHVIWKRAKDIAPHAQLAANKNGFICGSTLDKNIRYCYNRADQGRIGNCWFVAALSGISQNVDLFRKIVPSDNSFIDGEYCGLFHFRFWIYGSWYDVCVDDYLPVGKDGQLNFCHNSNYCNEFWSALLEKAYAKVVGSYEALDGGLTSDALVDMSGGVTEKFNLDKLRENSMDHAGLDKFWSILCQAQRKRSVVCCSIETDPNCIDSRMMNGLIKAHAYVVTGVVRIKRGNVVTRLLKCQNPWATKCQFRGDWSKDSTNWKKITQINKKNLFRLINGQGQFW